MFFRLLFSMWCLAARGNLHFPKQPPPLLQLLRAPTFTFNLPKQSTALIGSSGSGGWLPQTESFLLNRSTSTTTDISIFNESKSKQSCVASLSHPPFFYTLYTHSISHMVTHILSFQQTYFIMQVPTPTQHNLTICLFDALVCSFPYYFCMAHSPSLPIYIPLSLSINLMIQIFQLILDQSHPSTIQPPQKYLSRFRHSKRG